MDPPAGHVRADGARFLDASGRQIILHGLNIVDKSANWTDYPWVDEEVYAQLQQWGFNCIRLGFTWASVEPEPGRYSATAIAEIRRRVEWARKHRLYVILDMHQDLYSMKYSDGAPEWATLTDGKPHLADGKVWSDAYVTSPAVQTAMDNFYANRPGPGGVGLQDHFAGAWREIARAFADDPTVVGYDLMNEPFAGSLVPQGMALHLAQFARETGRDSESGAAEIARQWAQPEGRARILRQLDDVQLYARVMDAAQRLYQDFERTRLDPFFQRVSRAIREVDQVHIVFLETNGAANMGVYTAIAPITFPDGRRDPQQAYAPHAYDLVTDTPDVASASTGRLELILRRHQETAAKLKMPMIIGEWGAYYGDANVLPSAQFICRQFERMLCGDTFWALERDLASQVVLKALCRPYPLAIVGQLRDYRADPAARRFECNWSESGEGGRESWFYLPKEYGPDGARIQVEPAGGAWRLEPAGAGGHRYLIIPSLGRAKLRRLTIKPA